MPTFNNSFENIHSNGIKFIKYLAQGLKDKHSAYGNSTITQDHEDGIAKGSLDPCHVLPSNLKELTTTCGGEPYGPKSCPFHRVNMFSTRKRKKKPLVCYNVSRQNIYRLLRSICV